MDAKIWKVLVSLGVPGVALGVFLALFKSFKWDFETISAAWAGPIVVLFMLLVSTVTFYALTLWRPSRHPQSFPRTIEDSSRGSLPQDGEISTEEPAIEHPSKDREVGDLATNTSTSKYRRDSYRELWTIVEDIHIDLRIDTLDRSSISERIQRLNAFLLKRAIYLSNDDALLAREYVATLQEIDDYIQDSDDPKAKKVWRETDVIPREVFEKAHALETAVQKVNKIRPNLIRRVKAETGEET